MKTPEVLYILNERYAETLETLQSAFPTRIEEAPGYTRTFYDTFDWRLYGQKSCFCLCHAEQDEWLSWQQFGASDGIDTQTAPYPKGRVPVFAQDIPEGNIRDKLAQLMDIRCLLPIVTLESQERILYILNEKENMTVRLCFSLGAVRHDETMNRTSASWNTLRVIPVKGYDKAYRRVVHFIEESIGLTPVGTEHLSCILGTSGRLPGAYSSKIQVELDPQTPSSEAVRSILMNLFDTMRANETGARQNLDTEFLHDFRVAVRRTRSAITQIKHVFPRELIRHFREEFAWLGEITGPTRDLDVYLIKMNEYKTRLPDAIQDDLDPLIQFLQKQQCAEQRKLVKEMDTDRYRKLMRNWDAFLTSPDSVDAVSILEPFDSEERRNGMWGAYQDELLRSHQQTEQRRRLTNARRPVVQVASERIWRAYRRVRKQGKSITDQSSAQDLHRLRIECKKLRYLLEFFRSLYPPEEIDGQTRVLKILQDNLGDFNDYEIQQTRLKTLGAQMLEQNQAPAPMLMAIGRLVEHLENEQINERARFHECYARFSDRETRKSFRRLFKPSEKSP